MRYHDMLVLRVKILEDYHNNDVEFSTEFCNYEVQATKQNLLGLYAELQRTINGDDVFYVPNAQIEGDTLIGIPLPLSAMPGVNDMYTGNFKEFLDSFEEDSKDLYRFDEWDWMRGYSLDKRIKGTIIPFVL